MLTLTEVLVHPIRCSGEGLAGAHSLWLTNAGRDSTGHGYPFVSFFFSNDSGLPPLNVFGAESAQSQIR